jgi:hypothetical protein
MSGTITFRTTLNVTNGLFSDARDTGSISVTQSGLGVHTQIMSVQTGTAELIPTGDISILGIGFFRNVYDGNRPIEIGATGTSWQKMIRLESGQAAILPLATGIQLAALSTISGDSKLEYRIYQR